MGPSVRWVLAARLREGGVKIYTSSEVSEVRKNEVVVKTPEGEVLLKAGCIITALGFESDAEMVERVERTGILYCIIGDEKRPRRIIDAIREGYWAATQWVDGIT